MKQRRFGRRALTALIALLGLGSGYAGAGGFTIYEIGTADVGLATAGYGARAEDASTVMTNPAGMTRLEGTQVLLGAQAAYGDISLSLGTVAPDRSAGGGDGGNATGWAPGGGFFISHSVSPALKVGLAAGSNFGGVAKFNDDWAGRYYVQESALIGISLLPSIAYRVNNSLSLGASLNLMYGSYKNKVAVNNIAPGFGDGELKLEDNKWGYGVNLGLLYELDGATRFGLTYNSQVDLDFTAQAQFSGTAPGLSAVLAARGLQNANVNIGIKVPQGVMGSVSRQMNERWTLLGSVGWQQWSRFGEMEVGVESSNPTSLTANLNFKDTWHAAIGAQYRPGGAWLYGFGVAYDSKFQDSGNVPPAFPANDAWRFGVGAQKQSSKSFSWGVAAEYLYGGSLNVNQRSVLPVAQGGRGDLTGSFKDTAVYFVSANWAWKF